MDIGIFDDFEEDGQLTLFGLGEDFEELQMSGEEPTEPISGKTAAGEPASGKKASGEIPSGEPVLKEQSSGESGVGIRIRSCSSCGKLLFVREEAVGYVSACNACGIQYVQK